MDTAYWTYLDERHPIYDRPEEADRWQFAPEGLETQEYDEPDEEEALEAPGGQPYPQGEALSMDVAGLPSLEWRQGPSGNTILNFRLRSQHARAMDLDPIVDAAREMWRDFRRHSRGPYSLEELADMGHPYGYGERGSTPSWGRLSDPRKVPRYAETLEGRKSIGHPRGIRGSVPNMSVVNKQTEGPESFEQSWRWSYAQRGDGLTLSFWNERKSETGAPIAWFLAHGTIHMQAHGPWETVPRKHWPSIVNAWRQAARKAAQRTALDEGLFGAPEFDAMQRAASVRRGLV